jgi:hypothetical protein
MAEVFHIQRSKDHDKAARHFPVGTPKEEILAFMEQCEREGREGHLGSFDVAVSIKGPTDPDLARKRLEMKMKAKQQL